MSFSPGYTHRVKFARFRDTKVNRDLRPLSSSLSWLGFVRYDTRCWSYRNVRRRYEKSSCMLCTYAERATLGAVSSWSNLHVHAHHGPIGLYTRQLSEAITKVLITRLLQIVPSSWKRFAAPFFICRAANHDLILGTRRVGRCFILSAGEVEFRMRPYQSVPGKTSKAEERYHESSNKQYKDISYNRTPSFKAALVPMRVKNYM